jgi:hypothetical protein
MYCITFQILKVQDKKSLHNVSLLRDAPTKTPTKWLELSYEMDHRVYKVWLTFKGIPCTKDVIIAREDSTSRTYLSHFPELFLVKLKCQKLFYQMLSLRNLAQSKRQLPISKLRLFKRWEGYSFSTDT